MNFANISVLFKNLPQSILRATEEIQQSNNIITLQSQRLRVTAGDMLLITN